MEHPPTTPGHVQQPPTPDLGPVRQRERIASLDVLRGVAVLGILVMNIQSFAMPDAAYMNPHAYGDLTGANHWVWFLGHLLADQKFMGIFSMLFGAGIVLLCDRVEVQGGRSAPVYYRRMGWLILFGLLHAHLLWFGDILYSYGMCGLVAYLFRRMRPGRLLLLGALSITMGLGFSLAFGFSMPYWDPHGQQMMEAWNPQPEMVEQQLEAYRGSWLDQMSQRVPMALFLQFGLFAIAIGPKAGGMMLLGMGLFKLGIFSARRSIPFYIGLLLTCGIIGLGTTYFGTIENDRHEWNVKYSFFLGSQFNYMGSILTSVAWVALVMLWCKAPGFGVLRRSFAAVGQMAFTNYIMQTVICTTIFYGHGLGYYGSVERVGQILVVTGVWAFQIVASPIWLRYYRYGPLEWLWRSLTYWKLQPVRREQLPDAWLGPVPEGG